MNSYGLFSLITKPNYISHNSATLIDIFTNCFHNELNAGICSGVSDHMPIFCVNRGDFVDLTNDSKNISRRLITDDRILMFKEHLMLIGKMYT